MKTTPFTRFHEALGARMAPFAGYLMPIEYTGIKDEHNAVRQRLGVFDVSHMGEFWVKGPRAFDLVQQLTTNDVAALVDGKVQYTCFTNETGGIVDDLLVYRFNAEKYLLVVNASNIEKDWEWCVKHARALGMDVDRELENASDEICQLAVQGPLALAAMQKLTSADVTSMEYYTFQQVPFAGIDRVIFSTTGYTGSGGCEIYAYNADAEKLWNAVMEAGADAGIQPIGLGARDTLRLEAGFCLYGHEIDDDHSPIEAGLGWITKFVPGNDFVNRAYHEKLKENKPSRYMKPFEMIDKGIARQGYPVEDAAGNEIGTVCSGTVSPLTGKSIGTAYVKSGFHALGTEVFIRVRGKALKAKITKTPFF
ncbi:MAG: glycine cleavage system aminomethyltransferase GcvT [Odoribacteraceae bacterium]|jgi:aminomethyltransferase|nr:glycine cleavage system aminomethyltransferase GcvT [Odoribacteraceae bacterium]